MASLAELWDAAPTTATPDKRQADRMATLQDEMTKAQQRLQSGDARAQRDIEAITREMGGKVQPQQVSGQTLADLWESTPASTAKQEQKKNELPLAAQFYNKLQEGRKDLGASVASLADTTIGGILPMAGQVVQAASRPFTTPEKAQEYGQVVTSA
jgi:hypothetical protein